jgi:hypothetical protein
MNIISHTDPAYIHAAESLIRDDHDDNDDDDDDSSQQHSILQVTHRSAKQEALCIPSRLIGLAALADGDPSLFAFLLRIDAVASGDSTTTAAKKKKKTKQRQQDYHNYSYSPTLRPVRNEDGERIRAAVQERITSLQRTADAHAAALAKEAVSEQEKKMLKEEHRRQKRLERRHKAQDECVVPNDEKSRVGPVVQEVDHNDDDNSSSGSSSDNSSKNAVLKNATTGDAAPPNGPTSKNDLQHEASTTTTGQDNDEAIDMAENNAAAASSSSSFGTTFSWTMVSKSSKPVPARPPPPPTKSPRPLASSSPPPPVDNTDGSPRNDPVQEFPMIPVVETSSTLASSPSDGKNDDNVRHNSIKADLHNNTMSLVIDDDDDKNNNKEEMVRRLRHEIIAERQQNSHLRSQLHDRDIMLQSLQLRLYISDTRLLTYETALQDHLDQVQRNTTAREPPGHGNGAPASPSSSKLLQRGVVPRDDDDAGATVSNMNSR